MTMLVFRRCLAALQGGGVPWSYPGRTPNQKGGNNKHGWGKKATTLKQNEDFSNDFYLHTPAKFNMEFGK